MRGRPLGSGKKLEERRRKAVAEAVAGELTRAEIAKKYKVSLRGLYGWLSSHAADKKKGLKSRPTPGAPKRLSDADLAQLEAKILKGAKAAGFPNDLWTCARIKDVIKKEFGVTYHFNHVGKILAAMGWSPQRPEKRAVERDDMRIRDWVKKRIPTYQKKARELNAILVFADESAIQLSPVVRRTWAPRGQTPILKTKTRSHKKISAIGAIASTASGRKPKLLFRLHPAKNVAGAECVAFLEQLQLNLPRRHVFVIWDGLRAHWGQKVQAWLKKHPKFHLFKLPPYAPELNPIEYAWGHIKSHQLANLAPESETELLLHAKAAICRLRNRPDLLRSFLKHAPIYFFDK
jgi:transposase